MIKALLIKVTTLLRLLLNISAFQKCWCIVLRRTQTTGVDDRLHCVQCLPLSTVVIIICIHRTHYCRSQHALRRWEL